MAARTAAEMAVGVCRSAARPTGDWPPPGWPGPTAGRPSRRRGVRRGRPSGRWTGRGCEELSAGRGPAGDPARRPRLQALDLLLTRAGNLDGDARRRTRASRPERGPLWCCRRGWVQFPHAIRTPGEAGAVRELIGESLREERVAQGKTLREVSKARSGQSRLPVRGRARARRRRPASCWPRSAAALDLPLSVVLNWSARRWRRVLTSGSPRCRRVRAHGPGRRLTDPSRLGATAAAAVPAASSGIRPACRASLTVGRPEDVRAVGPLDRQLAQLPCRTARARASAAGASRAGSSVKDSSVLPPRST